MTGFFRQAAATALAVMFASAYPLAQAPAPSSGTPSREKGAPLAAVPDPATAALVTGETNADQTRDRLRELLDRHPPSLREVLRLDPTLLTDAEYLAAFPELAAFLAAHPEVAHNPAYYVGTREAPWERDPQGAAMRLWENLMQGTMIVFVLLLVTGVLTWLIRTVVDYRRWLRLTRVQTETHTKLLDRLTSQDDLLAYMQTPAGRRFLESAPITLDPASRPLGAPLSRVLWSVQAGVVLALGGIGLLFVSRRVVPEIAQGLSAIGILALALGAGFVLSAVIAYLLSSRLGLFDQRPPVTADTLTGSVLPPGRD